MINDWNNNFFLSLCVEKCVKWWIDMTKRYVNIYWISLTRHLCCFDAWYWKWYVILATVRGLKSDKDKTEVKEEEPKYEQNEVNGKFKIMSKWDEDLNDRSSTKFKKLEATIKEGLLEMLRGDENLKDQADFEVDIISFR